ncbi:calcium/sodium antiporter [Halorarum salinum]|uniref:Calcium/sodium antiporter n=1 Tax=Halorarum salinum TaxID=2743089 RepID=A0A7D5Q9G2_9EURY|nr:calcium/sodium antiporter [Halobaculum salinum]QLG60719.1 calcium/sodium antiporter [Halobaculum salinum]
MYDLSAATAAATLEVNTGWNWLATAATSESALVTLVGVVLLYLGAESLVKGASGLSSDLGMRAAVAGVTVVAFATTAPELVVGVLSGLDYGATLGLGAIIGSNVANIGLVLGLSALVRPMDVSGETLRRHVPFMALAALLLVGLGLDGTLDRVDGALFLVVLGGFTYVLLNAADDPGAAPTDADRVAADGGSPDDVATDGGSSGSDGALAGGPAALDRLTAPVPVAGRRVRPLDLVLVLVGLVLLVAGAQRLIEGGRTTLYYLGATDRFVGLTVLAFGTSLPELAASLISAARGEAEFSVGNVVGSNIYNVLAVLGVLALLTPVAVPASTGAFDFPMLLAFTVGAIALMARGSRVTRLDGLVLVVAYVCFFSLLL